jgi:hypothetical protein
MSKVLEAYLWEAAWPPNPLKAERQGFYGHWLDMKGYLHGMARVVVVLLRQRND